MQTTEEWKAHKNEVLKYKDKNMNDMYEGVLISP